MGACYVIWAVCGIYFFSAPAKPACLSLWVVVGGLIVVALRDSRSP
jgi:hypothetical protein